MHSPIVHKAQWVAAGRAAEGHHHDRPLARQLVVAAPRLQPHGAPAGPQILQPAPVASCVIPVQPATEECMLWLVLLCCPAMLV